MQRRGVLGPRDRNTGPDRLPVLGALAAYVDHGVRDIFRDGTLGRETAASDALVPPMTGRRSTRCGGLALGRRETRGVDGARHGALFVW